MGAPAKPFRMALGSLIIKEKLGISDRETVEQIRENPYLQFFIGQNSYSNKEPFDASMMVHFRQRIGSELIGNLNKEIVKQAEVLKTESTQKKTNKNNLEANQTHRGKLLIDATVAPSDIKYPTDVDLLDAVRKNTENIIDKMHAQHPGGQKPRTYRKQARKDYLNYACI